MFEEFALGLIRTIDRINVAVAEGLRARDEDGVARLVQCQRLLVDLAGGN